MANNPYVNKVQYGNQTIIDISGDTVTAGDLWIGVTAHDASGAPITGTLNVELDTLNISPTESTQEFFPEDPYWGFDSVTIGAISSDYVGSNITQLTSSDLDVSIIDFPSAKNVSITLPAGYLSSSIDTTGNLSEATFSTATNCTINTNGTISMNFNPSTAGVAYTNSTYSISRANAITVRTSSDLTASDATVTVPSGYYATSASKSVTTATLPTQTSSSGSGTSKLTIDRSTSDQYINIPVGYNTTAVYYKVSAVANGTAGTPTATKGTVSNHTINVTPSVTNTTGYITGGTKTGTAVSVSASELVSGTKTISANGTGIDVTNYASVDVSLPEASLPTQSAASSTGTQQAIITPSSSIQYINIPTGLVSSAKYYKINAVEDSVFVITIAYDDNDGMWIPDKTFTEISAAYNAGKTLVAEIDTDDPAVYEVNGYYEEGTGGNDGYYYTVAEWQEDLDFSLVALYYGYIDANGYGTDPPENYYNTSVADASANEVAAGSVFFNDSGYQTGTATRRDSTSLTVSGATVTAPAGYYASAASKTLSSATLPTQTSATAIGSQIAEISATSSTRYLNVSGGGYLTSGGYYKINPAGTIPEATLPTQTSSTSSGTKKATISRDTSTRYLNIPTGQISTAAYYEIEGVPNGSATTPATTISVTPTISVSNTGLVTASGSTSQNITPTISAGYISSGTAGAVTASASNTYQLERLTATAYNVSTSDQTIAAGQYITGQQRFKGVVVSDTLTAANIKSGVTITVGDADNASRITSVTGTYSGGSSGPALTLISTTSLGTLSTSSTSATDTGKSLSLASSTNFTDYDLLVVDISVNSTTDGRHTSSVSFILLTGTSNVNTKNTYTVGSNVWNSKLSSTGVTSTRQSTTKYGIYAYSVTVSDDTMTIPIYYRYNSSYSGTINGSYTARVYGVKLIDLIGG